MKILDVKIKKVKLTKRVIRAIAEIDKEFYTNFDYSDLSWYFTRYSRKNEATVLVVGSKIVGYFLFYNISNVLFDDICKLKFSGDYDFPESEVNVKKGVSYLPSVLVKSEFREFSPLLLRALLKEFKTHETIVAITISSEGKRMSEKFMTCVGEVKHGVCIFVKSKDLPKSGAEQTEDLSKFYPFHSLEI